MKTKDIDFTLSSQGKEINPKHIDHVKKKCQHTIYDDSNTIMHTEELTPPFKCHDCEFEGLSYKIFNIHKAKHHKIGAQADGINYEDIIEDISLHTFIL